MATKEKDYRKTLTLPNGEHKYLHAKSQEELDDKIMQWKVMTGSDPEACSEETFGHFAQMWYNLYKKPYLREGSLESIRYVLNQHILPYIGDYKLHTITPLQIQSIMAQLADKSYSLQSKVLMHMRSIFKVAQENGLIVRSPVSSMLKPGGYRTEEKVALTPEESRHLLNAVTNKRARTFLLIALHTGMRRGEIVALQWKDVDFENGVIHVTHNANMQRYKTSISDELKTRAGRRDVPMSEELEQWLSELYKRKHARYVIAKQDGQPMTISAFKSMWNLVDRELPSRHVTPHILRHTYITRLFEAGLDIKEIQYLAGHSTVDITLRIYTHYDRVSRGEETKAKVRNAFKTGEEAS